VLLAEDFRELELGRILQLELSFGEDVVIRDGRCRFNDAVIVIVGVVRSVRTGVHIRQNTLYRASKIDS
jgi:hypothetical protein